MRLSDYVSDGILGKCSCPTTIPMGQNAVVRLRFQVVTTVGRSHLKSELQSSDHSADCEAQLSDNSSDLESQLDNCISKLEPLSAVIAVRQLHSPKISLEL